MKLVVDTNILMTCFWKNSETKKAIMLNDNLDLIAPEFSLEEIDKYRNEIIKKTKISEEEFKVSKIDLAISVKFFPLEKYKDFLRQAFEISPDPDDIDFFALALKLNCPIWSNDKKLKDQDKIKVYSTGDILNIIN
ncbi:MAG: PIN domain-containing protein [Nanoarchaeota archaeon]|nr:PIN domain-containing protein [Nanoarchaeota archaeon]